jgi:hypothetical protein
LSTSRWDIAALCRFTRFPIVGNIKAIAFEDNPNVMANLAVNFPTTMGANS